jgi:broad specificity phosphatase PhoE
LLRHAETANPRIFHGAESDVDLSDRGRQQAIAIASYLVSFAPAVVISSAMRRALATAGPIARACGVELHVEPDLHERRVGPLSGTPASLDEGPWPDTVRRWMAGQTDYATPGAESFDALRARVMPIWERLTTQWEDRTVAVVAHGVVIRVLLLTLLPGRSVRDWTQLGAIHNVALTELVRARPEDAWRAERINEVVV